jgi:hypothetical protein
MKRPCEVAMCNVFAEREGNVRGQKRHCAVECFEPGLGGGGDGDGRFLRAGSLWQVVVEESGSLSAGCVVV